MWYYKHLYKPREMIEAEEYRKNTMQVDWKDQLTEVLPVA